VRRWRAVNRNLVKRNIVGKESESRDFEHSWCNSNNSVLQVKPCPSHQVASPSDVFNLKYALRVSTHHSQVVQCRCCASV
jgi:hypothetical protein